MAAFDYSPSLPPWNKTDYNRLINDALHQLKQQGVAYVCNLEHIGEIKKVYPNIETKKEHERCYLLRKEEGGY